MSVLVPDDRTDRLLWQQKKELAILNAIIQTVSASYNLAETLDAALEIVLSTVGSKVGWICLLDEHNKACSAFVGHVGLCIAQEGGGSTPCLVQCVCGRVQQTKDVVFMRQLAKGCPLLLKSEDMQLDVVGHVSIPMTTKSRVVGQLNVAFSDQQQADQIDIDLLKAIGPQLAAAVENARLWQEVQEKEGLRKRLLNRVVTAQEEERRRISRELHDELGQELNSLLIRLKVLEKLEGGPAAQALIDDLQASTAAMLESIHDLALELRPTSLDDLGLVAALAQYARSCQANLGVAVDFAVIGEGRRLPREVETTLYRVIQESLTNVARHSGASSASVLLKIGEQRVVAVIEDNGRGFDPHDTRASQAKKDRLGLYGMQERVALVGGTITIESAPGAGAHIYVEVPVAPQGEGR